MKYIYETTIYINKDYEVEIEVYYSIFYDELSINKVTSKGQDITFLCDWEDILEDYIEDMFNSAKEDEDDRLETLR